MDQFRGIPTSTLERRKRELEKELEERGEWREFKFTLEGSFRAIAFNHYNHVKNHILKTLNADPNLCFVRIADRDASTD